MKKYTWGYYQLAVNLTLLNKPANRLQSFEYVKVFEDPQPFNARIAAFTYYHDFIREIGQMLGLSAYENLSDREVRRILQPYLAAEPAKGVWISCHTLSQVPQQFIIHSITRDDSPMPNPVSLLDLEAECQLCRRLGEIPISHQKRIAYCDPQEFLNGFHDHSYRRYLILETPFDWTGYDTEFWWEGT